MCESLNDQRARSTPSPLWGFYAGGNVGYGWGRSDVAIDEVFTVPLPLLYVLAEVRDLKVTGGQLRPRGALGGLQAGYNWQADRNWVLGLETDFQWSGQKDRTSNSINFSAWGCATQACFPVYSYDGTLKHTFESKLTWLGTVRGRVGFVADRISNILFYGTGGLAYGSVETSSSATLSGLYFDGSIICGGLSRCSFARNAGFSETKTRVGWTVGGGVEGALGNNWTVKVEYLYVDLGTVNDSTLSNSSCSPYSCAGYFPTVSSTVHYSNKMIDNIVRAGVNYRFGG